MRTEMTEARTRRQIIDEFTKWKDGWECVVGIHDFPPPAQVGDDEALVRFVLREKPVEVRCSSQDAYRDNLRCVFYAIQAMRMNEKRGIADTIRKAYLQIEAPKEQRDPYEVLGVRPDAPTTVIEATYKALAKERHPDAGGNADQMKELNDAYERVKSDRAT
jgi:hypothetical protein